MERFSWRRWYWPLVILSFKIPQVIIVLWSGGLTDKISWLQYLVIAKSLFMASKGPAMEYLEAKSRRQATLDKEGCPYLQQTLAKKLQHLGKPLSTCHHLYLGIAQIAITPPPRTQTGTLGHFFHRNSSPIFTFRRPSVLVSQM